MSTEQILSAAIVPPLIAMQASFLLKTVAQPVPDVNRSGARFTHFTVFALKIMTTEQVINFHMLPSHGGPCSGHRQCSDDGRRRYDSAGRQQNDGDRYCTASAAKKWACLRRRLRSSNVAVQPYSRNPDVRSFTLIFYQLLH